MKTLQRTTRRFAAGPQTSQRRRPTCPHPRPRFHPPPWGGWSACWQSRRTRFVRHAGPTRRAGFLVPNRAPGPILGGNAQETSKSRAENFIRFERLAWPPLGPIDSPQSVLV